MENKYKIEVETKSSGKNIKCELAKIKESTKKKAKIKVTIPPCKSYN